MIAVARRLRVGASKHFPVIPGQESTESIDVALPAVIAARQLNLMDVRRLKAHEVVSSPLLPRVGGEAVRVP